MGAVGAGAGAAGGVDAGGVDTGAVDAGVEAMDSLVGAEIVTGSGTGGAGGPPNIGDGAGADGGGPVGVSIIRVGSEDVGEEPRMLGAGIEGGGDPAEAEEFRVVSGRVDGVGGSDGAVGLSASLSSDGHGVSSSFCGGSHMGMSFLGGSNCLLYTSPSPRDS